MDGCYLRVGVVVNTDPEGLRARVRYDAMRDAEGLPLISDWLQVVQRSGGALALAQDGAHSHKVTVGEGQVTTTQEPDHSHPGSVTGAWMPEIGEQVLALYDGAANGMGYVLGGVRAWR